MSDPGLSPQADLYIAALEVHVLICRDEGRPDHDRSSGMSAVWRISSTGL